MSEDEKPTVESILRDHFDRQKEISKRSIQAVSVMAQANADLIALSGINRIQSQATRQAIRDAKFQKQDPIT